MRLSYHSLRLFLASAAVLLLAACAAPVSAPVSESPATEPPVASADELLRVVSTVSPVTNIIYNIGGEHIGLSGIVPEGVNSHTFEPAPSDARVLAEADLIFINGLNLEEPTLRLAEANKSDDAEIVQQSNFYLGAGLWGFVATLLINQTVRKTQINADAAIGVITTASFAVGVALISRYRSFTRSFDAALFGNILGVTRTDVFVIAGVCLMVAIAIFAIYRQLLFTTFDAEVARVYGVPTPWVDTLFALLLAAALIAALQILGVTLIAAALVIPAITARLLTDSFNRIILLSTAIGASTGFAGMYLSYFVDVASGATIVLFQASLFVAVLALTSLQKRAQQRLLHTHIG